MRHNRGMQFNPQEAGFGSSNYYAADQPEQILMRFRRHGKALFWPVVALLLTGLLGGMYLGSFAALWQNLLLAAGLAVLVIAGFVIPLAGWFAAKSTITTTRVISRSGVVTRVRQEVAINRVRSISSRRSLLQRLTGSGNIALYIVGADEPLLLADVPDVKNIAEVLQQLVAESYRQDRAQTGYYSAMPQQPLLGYQADAVTARLPEQAPIAPSGFSVQRKL